MAVTDAELIGVVRDLGYLPEQKLTAALAQAHDENLSLADTLVRYDYLAAEDVGKLEAYHLKLPYVSLANIAIPQSLLSLLPERAAISYQTVAFELAKDGLHIASSRPEATDLFKMLAKKSGASTYHLSYATEQDIASALHLYKQHLQAVFDGILTQAQGGTPPVNDIASQLFEYAYDAKASDIHIEPHHDQSTVRFRIDGVLHDEAIINKQLHEQLLSRLKVLARMRTDEHLSAQDGRLHITVSGEELSIRVSIVPTVTGEKVVMRLLAKHSRQFSLTDLGMRAADLAKLRDGFGRPFGMILSTGPTGSGKTTTMYAILKILNTRERNIATIEDPVEYELDGINQIQANPKTNLTFSEGLRSLLRQDPDVLFVGEIRDQETADIAVNASMTGHLVLSTMHTNDAITTLPRLIDMGIEPFLAASTVNVIVGQRLVRQICGRCKTSLELTNSAKGWVGDPAQAGLLSALEPGLIAKHLGGKKSVRVYVGAGCSACRDTGYQGRIGVFEILSITSQLAKLITARADSDSLRAQAIAEQMSTMLDDGLEKVASGDTTLSEILRVTEV